jgi:hypothetical protein
MVSEQVPRIKVSRNEKEYATKLTHSIGFPLLYPRRAQLSIEVSQQFEIKYSIVAIINKYISTANAIISGTKVTHVF